MCRHHHQQLVHRAETYSTDEHIKTLDHTRTSLTSRPGQSLPIAGGIVLYLNSTLHTRYYLFTKLMWTHIYISGRGPVYRQIFSYYHIHSIFTSLGTSRSVVPIIVIVRHLDRGRHNPTVLLVWRNVTFFLFYDCINFSYPHTLLSQIVLVLLRIFLSSFG